MSQTPSKMRGWTFTSRGTPAQVLQLRSDLPKPDAAALAPHEVLVKISHVGVFQGFAKIMTITPHFTSNPWIPEYDFSGVVEAVGSQVSNVKPGDAVFGAPDPKAYARGPYNGAMVEYMVVPAVQAVRKPESISFEDAAGLPGSGCTAVQFADVVALKPGQRVLITAASGSLGCKMIQVARSIVGKDGWVVGVSSAANEQLVKGLGADEVVDYRSRPHLHELLTEKYSSDPLDVIIDIAGSDDLLYSRSPAYLKPTGIFLLGGKMSITHGSGGFLDIVSFLFGYQLQTRWPRALGGIPRRGVFHSGNLNGESLQRVARLVEEGQLKGLTDSIWPMEQALQAYERVATSRGRGKVVVQVQEV